VLIVHRWSIATVDMLKWDWSGLEPHKQLIELLHVSDDLLVECIEINRFPCSQFIHAVCRDVGECRQHS